MQKVGSVYLVSDLRGTFERQDDTEIRRRFESFESFLSEKWQMIRPVGLLPYHK